MIRILRFLHGLMAVLYVLSAAVQYNDPSPWPWVALYLAAATVAGLTAVGRPWRLLAWLVIAACVAWEIHYLRLGAWHTPFNDLTQEWHMTGENIVNGREFYALIWVAVWMGLTLVTPRGPKANGAAGS